MKGWFGVLLVWAVLAMVGSAYQMTRWRCPVSMVKHYSAPLEPIKPFYVFTRAFADSIVVAGADTIQTKENAVDSRYVRRLLIELLSYLPANDRPEPRAVTLEYREPPTPAQRLRAEAEQLQRQADRLEYAEELRNDVERAIAWLDSAGAATPAVGAEGPEAAAPEPTEGGE